MQYCHRQPVLRSASIMSNVWTVSGKTVGRCKSGSTQKRPVVLHRSCNRPADASCVGQHCQLSGLIKPACSRMSNRFALVDLFCTENGESCHSAARIWTEKDSSYACFLTEMQTQREVSVRLRFCLRLLSEFFLLRDLVFGSCSCCRARRTNQLQFNRPRACANSVPFG